MTEFHIGFERRLDHRRRNWSSENLLIFSVLAINFFVWCCGSDICLKFGTDNCMLSFHCWLYFNDCVMMQIMFSFVVGFDLGRLKLDVFWVAGVSTLNCSLLLTRNLFLGYILIKLIFVLIIIIILSTGIACKLLSLQLNNFLISFLFSLLSSPGASLPLTLLSFVLGGVHRSDG